jgi:hypothetical protein
MKVILLSRDIAALVIAVRKVCQGRFKAAFSDIAAGTDHI